MSRLGEIRGAKGRYELLGLIASGAMGRIDLARHRAEDGALIGEVVIKRVRPELARDPSVIQMFDDEAKISRRLSHPNIVRTLEVGKLDGATFLAMERVSGATLQEVAQRLLQADRVLPVPLVLDVLGGVLDALDYAHHVTGEDGVPLGVVHRDVSPQNIMVSFSGEVKLFDFGVGTARGKSHKTNPGLVKGKLAYMSPEQIRNLSFDARSDLFSLGVLAYEALVVMHPFFGKTDAMLMRAVIEQEPPVPSSVDPEFPEELSQILIRALQKDPDQRFQSGGEMRAALERFASGRVFPAGPSLGELMQELFRSRIRLEARARRRADDALLVRAIRGELEDGDLGSLDDGDVEQAERAQRRSEQMFANLPTAAVDVSRLRVPRPADPREAVVAEAEPAADASTPEPSGLGFDKLSTLLPAAAQARALDELRLLVDATPVPLAVTRLSDGQIVFANEPMAVLFGLGPTGSVGVNASSFFVSPAERDRLITQVKANGTIVDYVAEMKRRGGERFWGQVSARLVTHHGARVLIGSILDVSQRVEVESRLVRRLGNERHLSQAVAALLRTRDRDPEGAGLEEALEHLRAATDADRVVLVQNEEDRGGDLVMHRTHAVGVEAPAAPDRVRLSYSVVPRWRTLLERGDALRGQLDGFPEAERQILDGLGITSILAAPIARGGQWLGSLNLEATTWGRQWSDDDVATLESLARIIAGELERRQSRPMGCVDDETAALVSLGAVVRAEMPELIERARELADTVGLPELEDIAQRLQTMGRLLPSELSANPVARDLSARLSEISQVKLATKAGVPLAWVPAAALEWFISAVLQELASTTSVTVVLSPSRSGDVVIRVQVPADARYVWAALDGDPAALARPGTRLGALEGAVEAMGGDFRFERSPHLIEIVVELPAAATPPVAEGLAPSA